MNTFESVTDNVSVNCNQITYQDMLMLSDSNIIFTFPVKIIYMKGRVN